MAKWALIAKMKEIIIIRSLYRERASRRRDRDGMEDLMSRKSEAEGPINTCSISLTRLDEKMSTYYLSAAPLLRFNVLELAALYALQDK
eukprot:scaffold6557_cov109-Skeletonema_dohrnii-CCMP3373.AAC.8